MVFMGEGVWEMGSCYSMDKSFSYAESINSRDLLHNVMPVVKNKVWST